MKKIFVFAILLGVALSCVPTTQFREVDRKRSTLQQDRDELFAENEMLTVENREMRAMIDKVEAKEEKLVEDSIRLKLPELSYEISSRKVSRHACDGILVQFLQNGSLFSGHLLDYNACSFKAELAAVPPQTFEWIHPDNSVNVILSNGRETLYVHNQRF